MTVYKDTKTGKWYCQFYYIDWQGKRRHTSKRGFARKKDAEEWESKNKYNAKQKITMIRAVEAYRENLESRLKLGSLKPTSKQTYESILNNHIVPHFQNADIEKITPESVNKWLLSLEPSKGDNLSNCSLMYCRKVLSQIFKLSMREFNTSNNPVPKSTPMKKDKTSKRASLWTLEEYTTFYNSLKKDGYRLAYNLMFWAGLRIGEVMALTKTNFGPYYVEVLHTKSFANQQMFITSPKTPSSKRKVIIPKFLYMQAMSYIARCPYIEDDELLFKFSAQTLRYNLDIQSEKLDLPRISPHILRHSYASILLNLTKDATVVSKQIGHSNPNITLSIYSHMLPGEDEKAVEMLESMATVNGQKFQTIDVETAKIDSENSFLEKINSK